MNKSLAAVVTFALALSAPVWGQEKTVADETKLAQALTAPATAYSTDIRPGEPPSGSTMVVKPITIPAELAGPKVVSAPKVMAGDWIVRHRQIGPDIRISIKEVRSDGTMVVMQGSQSSLFTTTWDAIQSFGAKTGDYITYSPAFPLLQFPLSTGKKWEASVEWNSGRYNGTMQVQAVAGDWTTLSVDGKAVDVIEVRYIYSDGTKVQCWYAPSVPFWAAKCESTNAIYAFSIGSFGTEQKTTAAQ